MNKEIVAPKVDFADSELISYHFENRLLLVNLASWNEKLIRISFLHPIYFSFKLGYHISNLYKINEETELFLEALNQKYETVPLNHPFHHFQIRDLDDFPFMQIVAKSVTVEKLER